MCWIKGQVWLMKVTPRKVADKKFCANTALPKKFRRVFVKARKRPLPPAKG